MIDVLGGRFTTWELPSETKNNYVTAHKSYTAIATVHSIQSLFFN
ncbi:MULTISPECIES: hypothetical protein [unclassified Sporosarcina]|nr:MULTISPECIES: hypothetical protein [unclassified Sporosarcina]